MYIYNIAYHICNKKTSYNMITVTMTNTKKPSYRSLVEQYNAYTNIIDNMVRHTENIYCDCVIDADERNNIITSLNNLVKKLAKSYNKKIPDMSEPNDTLDVVVRDYPIRSQDTYLHELNYIDYVLYNKSEPELFPEIKDELDTIISEYGYIDMKGYLNYITKLSHKTLEPSTFEQFTFLDDIFRYHHVVISAITTTESNIAITPIKPLCDSLVNNSCRINIRYGLLGREIIYTGYIVPSRLNIYYRTCQLCSKALNDKKNEIKHIMAAKNEQIDPNFVSTYLKINSEVSFIIKSPDEIVDEIYDAYNYLLFIQDKSIDYFVSMLSSYKFSEIYRIINLLLLSDSGNRNIACLLFDILGTKPAGRNTIQEIIYRNLPFEIQKKLSIGVSSITSAVAELRARKVGRIPIEKKLATMPHLPEDAKLYILDKNKELYSDESKYKADIAIEGILKYPWKPHNYTDIFTESGKNIDSTRNFINNINSTLTKHIYGQGKCKRTLVEIAAKWLRNPESTGKVIGLSGPPGVGKTLLATVLGKALNIPVSTICLGGMSDASDLDGHNYTYANAQYGMIVRQMIKAGKWRSILVFDELDKVSTKHGVNEIHNTLLHITDPNMNRTYNDRFYSTNVNFDLRGALIIFTYNDSRNINPILLDRIKEIQFIPYSIEDKINIAKDYIFSSICKEFMFDQHKISIDDNVIKYIIETYTKEAGVRTLREHIHAILSKINLDRITMSGPFTELTDTYTEDEIFNLTFDSTVDIDIGLVDIYLDNKQVINDKINEDDHIGVVNGLYAIDAHVGGICPIQIYRNHVKNTDGSFLKITGNQKKVMKESISCALTVAMNMIGEHDRNEICQRYPYGFHVHVPDGGTPKDGPSAGCAFTVAFISVLTCRKVNRFVGMTGEIDLLGRISAIGGLSAKLHGAKKGGITKVYIPKDNEKDYMEIKEKEPTFFDDTFQIRVVSKISDLIDDVNVMYDHGQSL